MSALSSVLVKFTADISDVQSRMREAMGEVRGVSGQMNATGEKMGGVFSKLKSIALPAIGAITTALGGMSIGKGIAFDAQLEQAAISFETLLGSAERAKNMVKDLQNFASSTPFEFPGLQNSAKLMLAMGFNATSVMPNLKAIGDAVAAIGGGEDVLNGVTMALGQMATKGKVSAEEMNQLAERGIPAWDLMAQKLGMSKQQLMELSAQGKIMADQAVPALISAMGEKFDGAMQKQSQSFTGLMSTLKDNVNMVLGKAVEPLFNKLKDILPVVIEFTNKLMDGLTKGGIKGALETIFPPAVVGIIMGIANAIQGLFNFIINNWGIIKPILIGVVAGFAAFQLIIGTISAIITVLEVLIAVLTFVTSPIGIIVIAIGALVAIGYLVYSNWSQISAFLVGIWNYIKEAALAVWNGIVNFFVAVWNGIVVTIQTVWNFIVGIFSAAGNVIMAYVNFVWGFIGGIIQAYMGTIVAVLTAVWETIKVIFATAILVVYNIVTGHWDKIGEVFRAAGEKLWGIVSKLWETVKSLWVNAFNAVWQHTVQTWEAIKNAIMTGINAVVSFFSNAWNNFKSIVSNGWNAIISFFTSAPGKIMNAMSTIASNVKNAFVNMVSNAGEMGKNLVHGFINGVINLGGWIASKISGFFRDNVLGTAKRILGIASPSKVMKEFGKFTSEGLAIGISSNAGMAINSAEKMASGVVGAVAKMGELPIGVSASTPGVNTSYFVGASEGTDQGTGNGVAIQIGSLVVREEADIQKIAEQLYRLQKQGQRTRGSF